MLPSAPAASVPSSALLFVSFSLPPRSTRKSFDLTSAPVARSLCRSVTMKNVWARDEFSFMAVAALRFAPSPVMRASATSARELTGTSRSPSCT